MSEKGPGLVGRFLDRLNQALEEQQRNQASQPSSRTVSALSHDKCPHCGKRLKAVFGSGGWKKYAVCHHCGRHVND
jgi:hypothetical protein